MFDLQKESVSAVLEQRAITSPTIQGMQHENSLQALVESGTSRVNGDNIVNHTEAMRSGEIAQRTLDPIAGTETQNSSSPAAILYRYLHKDDDGEILAKKESTHPIDFTPDDTAAGLTTQTVLEILTTRISRTKLAGSGLHNDHNQQNIMIGRETVMKIHSIYLINALREVILYYPTLNLRKNPVVIKAPYEPLVHYLEDLKTYKENQPDEHDEEYVKTTNEHIDVLLRFLDDTLGKRLQLELEGHRRPTPVASFEYLWLFFKPGEDLYVRLKGGKEYQPVVVAEIRGGFIGENKPVPYRLYCWNVGFVQGAVRPLPTVIHIAVFDGTKEIMLLPAFPRRFHPEDSILESRLIERGKKYLSLCKPSYQDHSGLTIRQNFPFEINEISFNINSQQTSNITLNGKVMIDFFSYEELPKGHRSIVPRETDPVIWNDSSADGCACKSCQQWLEDSEYRPKFLEYEYRIPEEIDEEKPDHFYFLCDRYLRAYALNERRWECLHIDQVTDPKIEPQPFENLVLEPDIKNTIASLVRNYAESRDQVQTWSTDFIKDKGEGLVFLLHGSPGVGKTCTAECVADLIRRPLLPLTCGDMGIDAAEVESNFKRFFELGERWGAVVLLDEADVYLEQRTSESLQRNSLVSVFLRTLEYFRGILFLTTNRVGSFDDAFMSRINVSFHYELLHEEQRTKIWQKNFKRLEREENIKIEIDIYYYQMTDPDMKACQWNGREIRNAFQTAVALAKDEARQEGQEIVVLKPEHLRRVVKMSTLFKKYIDSTHHDEDEAMRAIRDERRNDAFRMQK